MVEFEKFLEAVRRRFREELEKKLMEVFVEYAQREKTFHIRYQFLKWLKRKRPEFFSSVGEKELEEILAKVIRRLELKGLIKTETGLDGIKRNGGGLPVAYVTWIGDREQESERFRYKYSKKQKTKKEIDFRTLDPREYVALEVTFLYEHYGVTEAMAKIVDVLGDERVFWVPSSSEVRSYIVRKNIAEKVKKLADESVEIEVKSLSELIREFEEDPMTVEEDYLVTEIKEDVYTWL